MSPMSASAVLLIKRRRPFEAVALLEAKERPPCLRAGYAVERTVVEPYHVKLYLHPPDVVFRRICGIQPLVRRFKVLISDVIGISRKVHSGATDPQRQY